MNNVIIAHNLIEKPSNKALMGQASEEKALAVQVEGQDAIWMTIKEREPYKIGDQESKQKRERVGTL